MAFSDDEKVRIRYHLGFINVNYLYTFHVGVASSVPNQSILEGMMERVLPEAEYLVRKVLSRCETTEDQMFENQDALVVDAIEGLQIRSDGQTQFRNVYLYWRSALANLLAVAPNPYDQRFETLMNVPVRH